ncbi:MAG: hypothetical protein AAFX06_02955 [Planctomycetota bacterium]
MPDSPAKRLQRRNREAIALLSLGVDLDLGISGDPVAFLREVNDRLSASSDDDVEGVLEDETLPQAYQSIARMLVAADDPAPIFQSIAHREEHRKLVSSGVNQAMMEPLVVFTISYLGLLLICFFVVPHIEAQFEQQWESPGTFTKMLLAVRDWLPVWAVVAPIAVLITLVFMLRNSVSLGRLLPGGRLRSRWLSSLGQTRRLRALAASEVSTETAIQLAKHDGEAIGPFSQTLMRESDTQARLSGLRRLTQFYRFLVQEPATASVRGAAPTIGILLGGVIVLGFALVLFLPWIEVLQSVVPMGASQ